ncbi:proteinase-activated receptor 3 [Ornithorhynchus anatinus]|uniref:Coagulation factor II thrombin receptor like 2 n=1 Tax=Ornithorhynchus anatinus TaxID=9258 RepID=F7G3G1_ORNAN|nr:proteinase-activated receptor 3 [Ornithorhynchus anatinus]
MKTLVLATTGLFLLSAGLGQKGAERDTANPAKPTPFLKTFRGAPQDVYEDIPLSVIEGWTSATLTKGCSGETTDGASLRVNNATLGYLTSSLSTKLIPTVYIMVFALGVPANAVTLWMLLFQSGSVSVTIFYTNLAVADFLFCLTLPFKISYHLNGNNWLFGEAMCRATTVIFYGNMYCSILLLACISLSRYLAVVHPFLYRRLPRRHYAILACGLVWLTVFLYMLPFFILKQEYHLEQLGIFTCHDVHNTCETISPFQFYYFISLAVFGFLVPLGVIVFCYVTIVRSLKAYDQKWFWYVKVSLLILSIFAICFTPSNMILIAHHANYYYNNMDDLYVFYLVALCLGSLNSCLDPFLYFLMSKITDHSSSYLTTVKTAREQ